MKTFRQLSEQLDVSSEHGPNAGRFASGGAKKVITTQPQVTPRREVDENAPEAGDDITNQPSPALVRKNGKIKSADALPDAEMGGTMSRYMPEARMSAAVKLQRAFQRQQEKSAASRKRAEELLKPKQEPAKPVNEDLRKWFDKDHPEGGWKRINSKGEAIGPCAREPGEPKPKCMSNEKRASLSKKERAAAVAAKRKHDPNPERKGEPINVSNFGKGKISEDMEHLEEKNVPTSPEKWAQAKAQAKAKFDVYPSAYANGWAAKKYKAMGGGWKSVSEAKEKTEYDYEGDMARGQLQSVINNAQRVHDMLKDNDNLPEWVQSKITLAEDYISTVANYMMSEIDEEVEQLEEGRPSQRHPLEGHEYHKKSNDALVHIAKDAHAAAEAMKGHNTAAENKYRDQANDSATVRYFRQKNGMPDWYKKKYGHVNEEAMNIDEKLNVGGGPARMATTASGARIAVNDKPPFDGPYKKTPTTTTDKSGATHGPMSRAKHLARDAMKKVSSGLPKKKLEESRKAEIVKQASKDAKKKSKEKDVADDKFQPEPTLDSQVIKTD
jgi:hypothetical protein